MIVVVITDPSPTMFTTVDLRRLLTAISKCKYNGYKRDVAGHGSPRGLFDVRLIYLSITFNCSLSPNLAAAIVVCSTLHVYFA